MNFEKVEKYRIKRGPFATNEGQDYGAFFIPAPRGLTKAPLKVICAPSDMEWQHVSVSLPSRTPTWDEMNFIKDLFWTEDDCVVQYHPPKKDYVNNCGTCLHLWKWQGGDFPRPPKELVGVK